MSAFGRGKGTIQAIYVINLDRQPRRWRRVVGELERFQTSDGETLLALSDRISAIDARKTNRLLPMGDVDPIYSLADQLFVAPDPRLARIDDDQIIRMTPQEIAVARSHIEIWKRISESDHDYVLVLEDDVYFAPKARALINQTWRDLTVSESPLLKFDILYLSYEEALGGASKVAVTNSVFRPVRGLWHFSGYVLSREGARRLLCSMPVVGPVDLWINHHFETLRVFATARPALLQRPDGGSDNSYSINPFLSRAGIVETEDPKLFLTDRVTAPIIAWEPHGTRDAIGMALSMLGFRCCSGTARLPQSELEALVEGRSDRTFDAYVNVEFADYELAAILKAYPDAKFITTKLSQTVQFGFAANRTTDTLVHKLGIDRSSVFEQALGNARTWEQLCDHLGRELPIWDYPVGALRSDKLFSWPSEVARPDHVPTEPDKFDGSPWVAPGRLVAGEELQLPTSFDCRLTEGLPQVPGPSWDALRETFPGNRAYFDPRNLSYDSDSLSLTLRDQPNDVRELGSASFASRAEFLYGRFEAVMRPANVLGVVTGFFLYRSAPRQEIDIEILGRDTTKMLTNVYFNPGDSGATLDYGYRGTPLVIDLGFDASDAYHCYAIDWSPNAIRWFVDGKLVHVRESWQPTPVPHLPMKLQANLWAPTSVELAGHLRLEALPASCHFSSVKVMTRAN